ncbi:MAG: lipid A biosynthesis lauroyl acyltransferase, partial [Gammaproteobacteria bacterium]
MNKKKSNLLRFAFLHPKYWFTWLGLGILRLIILLPWCAQRKIAAFVGWLIYHLAKRRRLIAKTNIDLCFPDRSPAQREQLLHQTLYENALGLIETGHAFWSSERRLTGICHFYGLSALQNALKRGRGVILVGA